MYDCGRFIFFATPTCLSLDSSLYTPTINQKSPRYNPRDSICGIHCTKFEYILKATLMPTNRTRGARGCSGLNRTLRLRGDVNQCASDTLADSRVQKPKNFFTFFSRLPSTAKQKKKWKGNFWFCFAVSVSEKSNLILTFLFALFSTLTATEARPYPRLVVTLNSVPSTADSDNSSKWSLAIQNSLRYGEAQICMCWPRSPVRTHHPRRFEEKV